MNTETRAPVRAVRKEGALARWIITAFFTGLLLLGGYKGALWLQANRDTVLRQPPFAPAGTVAQPPALAASGFASARPARPGARQPGSEPPAPAVLGNAAPPAAAEDESAPGVDNEQAARDAQCGYLAAEIARLGHEFDQPLPPPVLDQIAGQLKALRERNARLKCAGEPAPPAAASAPARAHAR